MTWGGRERQSEGLTKNTSALRGNEKTFTEV